MVYNNLEDCLQLFESFSMSWKVWEILTYGLTFTADNVRHIICDFQVLVLPILHLQTFTQAYMKTYKQWRHKNLGKHYSLYVRHENL